MIFIVLLSICALILLIYFISARGKTPPDTELTLTEHEAELLPFLEKHVRALSSEIGNRSFKNYDNLEKAGAYIYQYWSELGLTVRREEFQIEGRPVVNFYVEFEGAGQPEEIIIVGAHYDSVGSSCPGANDNGSGVAALLEIAARFKSFPARRTVRFIAFVNEESPYFATEKMGSRVHARGAKRRGEKIVGMLSLETIGYYSTRPKSQRYPFPFKFFLPNRGDFIAFISNLGSKTFLAGVVSSFRSSSDFPSISVAAPAIMAGIARSDQWAFWREGYSAVMVTDTAPYRYPHYHKDTDTFDKLDYQRLAKVVRGLEEVIKELGSLTGRIGSQ